MASSGNSLLASVMKSLSNPVQSIGITLEYTAHCDATSSTIPLPKATIPDFGSTATNKSSQ